MKELLKDFFYGQCANAYKYFGAHFYLNGYIFRVYAPLAKEVELVGAFNNWDGSNHKMEKIDSRGIYELYVEGLKNDYELYKFNILTKKGVWILKSDPYAFYSELRPNTASKTYNLDNYAFNDAKWMEKEIRASIHQLIFMKFILEALKEIRIIHGCLMRN